MRTPTRNPLLPQAPQFSEEAQEQIRQRAYELYERRGREDGHDMDDWLQAEFEVTGMVRTKAA